jgi:hypothetical protein
MDVAELFAICAALGVRPHVVLREAEAAVARPLDVAAYDETHAIEDEQVAAEEA